MKTVKEVSRISSVSVRTLHHYDAIGLLKPAQVTQAGYRLYDEESLRRLQAILLLRELQFPLKQIKEILDAPGFDPAAALEQQIHLLQLQRQRLDALIAHARQIQKTGVTNMDFTPFDRSELDEYAAEAKARWGSTAAYREYRSKTEGHTPDKVRSDADGLMEIFARFGAIRGLRPDSSEAQALVEELQAYITAHYYTCSKQILAGLGQMYTADARMMANIDRAGGDGTAQFAADAIAAYCGK